MAPTEPSPARRARPAASPSRRSSSSSSRTRGLSPAEQKPRRTLIAGSALVLLGLASVGVDSSDIGTGLTILGTLLLIVGIHTFGRLGPDTPEAASPDGAGDNDADDATEHVGA